MGAIRSGKTLISKTLSGIDLTGIRARVFDAENQIVGHLATQLAVVLQGKDKPTYLPSRDKGDVCVVTNASKIHFTGNKWEGKFYRWHTGYPGGLRKRRAKEVFARRPEDILWKAVNGMLPKNHLRRPRLRKLLIFPEDHNLKDIELVKWEVPFYMTKKLHRREGNPAPKLKGSFS